MMRSLGYPRLISIENFRTPNFELTADILYWLVQRYDPGVDISDSIEDEQDRVMFIKNIAHIMATRARIKLNTKKLYGSDGYAVKEMLKIATLLYEAMSMKGGPSVEDDDGPIDVSISGKSYDIKTIRTLASEITSQSASLYDKLGAEPELREERRKALSRHVELEVVEKAVKGAIGKVNDEIKTRNTAIEQLDGDQKNLKQKIEKKSGELDRNQKRLASLQSVRPTFMDDYEKLEDKLKVLYEQYLQRFRNLEFLENEMAQLATSEREAAETHKAQMGEIQRQIKEQNLAILLGNESAAADASDEDFNFDGDDFMSSSGSGDELGSDDDDHMGRRMDRPDILAIDLDGAPGEALGLLIGAAFLEAKGVFAEHIAIARHVIGPGRQDARYAVAQVLRIA